MQSAIDKLKEKPKEQKTAVAGGIATAVVAILLIGWGFFYLKKVLSEQPVDEYTGSPYDFSSLRDTDGSAIGGSGDYYDSNANNANPFGESRSTNVDF